MDAKGIHQFFFFGNSQRRVLVGDYWLQQIRLGIGKIMDLEMITYTLNSLNWVQESCRATKQSSTPFLWSSVQFNSTWAWRTGFCQFLCCRIHKSLSTNKKMWRNLRNELITCKISSICGRQGHSENIDA